MKCPQCDHDEDRVIDSRSSKNGMSIRRRRVCQKCDRRFSTMEEIVPTEIFVIKNNGDRQDFNPQKIRIGIEKACYKLKVREEQIDDLIAIIISKIEQEGKTELTSRALGEIIMKELEGFNDVAYVRFASVYRQFRDINQFIKEISQLGERRK